MVRKYGKRQRFGDRYVARNARGEFISNVDVGRSLAQDRARKAKDQDERSGFGQMGDEKEAEYEAQGYNAKLDESLGMSHKQSMMRQSRKARRDESKGTEKYDGSRAYSRVKTMDMSAENLAVADVDIHDGMNIPAGSGAIIGQAIPETDFTPFGASAEGYDDKLDESLGMSHKESKMKQSLKARRDESKGMKKASGKRAYSRVGTMDMNADYFENAAGGFYPTGDGRAFGSMTLDNTYAPLAAAEGDITSGFKTGMGATLGVIGGLAFAGWVGGIMSSLSDKKDA
ncbi:hypothetical protein [Planktomarina sp.]|uniref:hypothetical protein n=1 Tax=Planktomarina sp. TaxID=2024851 RepID=UPI003261A5B9